MVDLQGVYQIARCFALYSAFTSLSLLTGTPFMGLSLHSLVVKVTHYSTLVTFRLITFLKNKVL